MSIIKHNWNTGRQYTKDGQRITVELHPYEGIYFKDIDRCIMGWIPWVGIITDMTQLQEIVMFCYDNNSYQSRRPDVITEDNARNIAATAVNMYDGMSILRTEKWGNALAVWGQGFLELTLELGAYALYSEQQLIERNPEDYPGVYDYEVSYPFGAWYANQLLELTHVPTRAEGCTKLRELADAFFNKGR
jgi:hypothetical protein